MNNEALTHRIAIGQRFAQRILSGDAVFLQPVSEIAELPHTMSEGQKRFFSSANAFMLLQVMKDRGWNDARFFTADQIAQSGWELLPDARFVSLQFLVSTGDDGLPLESPEVKRFRVFNAGEINGVPQLEINSPRMQGDFDGALAEAGFSLDGSEDLSHRLAVCMLGIEAGLPDVGAVPAYKANAWAQSIKANPISFFEAAQAGYNMAASVMRQVELTRAERQAVEAIQKAATDGVDGTEAVQIKTEKGVAMVRKASARIEAMFAERQAVLAVPYEERQEAKALGAEWYPTQSIWFVPKGVPIERFEKWNARRHSLGVVASTQVYFDEFAKAMADLGLVVPTEIIADGAWHAVPVASKKKVGSNKAGAYILSLTGSRDGGPIGTINNKDTGQSFTWKYRGPMLTPEQRARMNAEIKQREAQAEREMLAAQNDAAGIAKEIFSQGTPADQHGYVLKKGISAEGLRQVPGSVLLKYDCFKSEAGKSIIRSKENYLLVPMANEAGELRAVQAISSDGAVKTFMRGAQKRGLMHVLGAQSFTALVEQSATLHSIAYVEGLATGASVRAGSDMPVVVCFDASNLEAVVALTAEGFPSDVQRVLTVDNDQFFVERAQGFLSENLGVNPHVVNGRSVQVADGRRSRDVALGEMRADGHWHKTPKGTYCASLEYAPGTELVRSLTVEIVPNAGRKVRSMFGNRGLEAGRNAMVAVADLVAKDKARAVHTVLVVPEFKDLHGRPTDFNDLAVREGEGAVRSLLREHGAAALRMDALKVEAACARQVASIGR